MWTIISWYIYIYIYNIRKRRVLYCLFSLPCIRISKRNATLIPFYTDELSITSTTDKTRKLYCNPENFFLLNIFYFIYIYFIIINITYGSSLFVRYKTEKNTYKRYFHHLQKRVLYNRNRIIPRESFFIDPYVFNSLYLLIKVCS
jgi:hypothetical protein